MTVDCDTFLHAVTQELLLCTLFSYFYHFGLERDGANETRREREQTMGMRSCLVEVVLLQFPSLPESPSLSPVVFPGQLYLLFQLCVRVYASL